MGGSMPDGPSAIVVLPLPGGARRMAGMTAGGAAPAAFVGRERELGAILDSAAAGASGRSATILLEGSSGMGASRLIDEALRRIADPANGPGRPVSIIRADSLPAWRGAPYAPFRTAVDRFLDGRPIDQTLALLDPGAEILLPLLPRTAGRLGGTDRRWATRERLADRILEAFRGVIGRASERGPVILVLEDLHVLDAASRSLLAFLSRTLGDRPVTIIGSYQPEALGPGHPLRATLEAIDGGPRPSRRIALPPLDRADLRLLITSHEGVAPSAPVLLLVAERSGGSPLLAEEVLVARRELSGASLTVPLGQMVVARAARRTPECRRVLRILAVADGPLAPSELGAVAAAYDAEIGRPAPRSSTTPRRAGDGLDGDLAAGVAEAVAHGFAELALPWAGPRDPSGRRPVDGSTGNEPHALRIRNELIAAALAADLLPGARRRLHAALGAVLADHPAEASCHWHTAHEARQELACTLIAAAEAEEIGAAADALVHLERAIELAGAPVTAGAISAAGEVELLGRAADAAAASGDAGRAEAFIEAAIARHADRTDRAVRADLTARLGFYRLAGGDRDGAVIAFQRALELLSPGPGAARARLLATFAQVRMLEGAFSEATHLAEDAIAATAGAGPAARAWLGHATCTLGVVDGWLGRMSAAIARLEAALGIALELGCLDDAFRARANLATILDLDGRRVAAVEVTSEGISAATAAGLEVAHGNLLRGNAADFLVSLGRWREARDMAAPCPRVGPVRCAPRERGAPACLRRDRDGWRGGGRPPARAALPRARDDSRRPVRGAHLRGRGIPGAVARRSQRRRAGRPCRLGAHPRDGGLAAGGPLRHDGPARCRRRGAGGGPAERPRGDLDGARLGVPRARGCRADGGEGRRSRRCPRPEGRRGRPGHGQGVSPIAARRRRPGVVVGGGRSLGRDRAAVRRRPGPLPRGGGASSARRRPAAPAATGAWTPAHPSSNRRRSPWRSAPSRCCAHSSTSPSGPGSSFPLLPSSSRRHGPRRPPTSRAPRRHGRVSSADNPPPPPSTFGLSPREQGVLAEIVAGRTNREIGERLFISEKTVGVHVGNILAKLGVGGRVEAATVALRLGLVDDRLERTKKPGPTGPGFRGRRRGGAA